jgi:F-type H+-transporting ATPase subunit b
VDERKAYIDRSLESAHEANEQLAHLKEEGAAILAQAREEQARILQEANEARNRMIEEARREARIEGEKTLEEVPPDSGGEG